MGKPKVHIVDDEATLRTVLRAVMAEAGYPVEVSDSGEQALEILQRQPCDVLLVDKNLPGINGIDLSVRALEEQYARHCIMITGYPSLHSLIDALNAGVEGYLTKPFPRLDDPVRLVAELVGGSRRVPQISPRQMHQQLLRPGSARDPSCVAVLAQRAHRDQWLRRVPGTEVFAHAELGLSALSEHTPDLVVADDGGVLAQLMQRAGRACACLLGAALSFEQGLQLMRIGGVIVVDPAMLAAVGEG